jgi:hypothetical protein
MDRMRSSGSSAAVQWMWDSSPNPWSYTEPSDWKNYSNVDNLIIEKAHVAGEHTVELEGYLIDIRERVQISKHDQNKRRPIKRVTDNPVSMVPVPVNPGQGDQAIREPRFRDLPAGAGKAAAGQYGWVSPFIIETRHFFNLPDDAVPSRNPELIPDLVEKAAYGIGKEGSAIGKRGEAEKLAQMLLEKKHASVEEVWTTCVHSYTMESFLYKLINATLRLVGSSEDEPLWRSKLPTLGPFCLLLWDDPFNAALSTEKTLYRGANLSPEHIAVYRAMNGRRDEYRSFQSFVSSSRNRVLAECFGNTLFVMEVLYAFIADISSLSAYKSEEEELIMPGVCFRVKSVECDRHTNKHIIHLELRQRFSGEY